MAENTTPMPPGQWWNKSLNLARGCDHDRCAARCWAVRQAIRIAKPGQAYHGLVESTDNGPRWTGMTRIVPELLAEPLKRKPPTRYAVSLMGDLFRLTFEEIAACFGVFAACPQHTFIIPTKQCERAAEWFAWAYNLRGHGSGTTAEVCKVYAVHLGKFRAEDGSMPKGPGRKLQGYELRWPLPNVHILASVCNQADADRQIPHLLACPAAVRGVSYEPAIGRVDWRPFIGGKNGAGAAYPHSCVRCGCNCEDEDHECPPGFGPRLDGIIMGAESGPGARPMDIDWARETRDACVAAGASFMFKQAKMRNGEHAPHDGIMVKAPLLDGRTWKEVPHG